jgi:hypothetical protein
LFTHYAPVIASLKTGCAEILTASLNKPKTLKILNRIEKIMAVLLNVTKTTGGLLREERFEKRVVIRIFLLSFPLDSFSRILHLQEYQTGLLAFLGKKK